MPAGAHGWIPNALLSVYRRASKDVCIVSYPGSGRTWLRLMIGKALASVTNLPVDKFWDLHTLSLGADGRKLPRIIMTHDDNAFTKLPQDISIKEKFYAGRKIIFLARDPRDLVVSWYFEQLKRSNRSGGAAYDSFKGPLEDFIDQQTGSLDTIIAFYNIWFRRSAGPGEFLLTRYEDFHHHPEEKLRRCLAFCGVGDIAGPVITEAVAYAAFDNMREMEKKNSLVWDEFQPGDIDDGQSFKTRQGKIGDHRNQLNPEICDALDAKIANQLDPGFGYSVAGGRNKA